MYLPIASPKFRRVTHPCTYQAQCYLVSEIRQDLVKIQHIGRWFLLHVNQNVKGVLSYHCDKVRNISFNEDVFFTFCQDQIYKAGF